MGIYKTIDLTKGYTAKVDPEDYDLINYRKWCASITNNGTVYAQSRIEYKLCLMHRIIMGISDPKIIVDHIDHDTLNNCKYNLRVCSRSENNRNKRSHKNSSSKYLGVSWDKSRNKWKANICYNRKNKCIGRFSTEKEAALAYDKHALSLFGEYANLNFKQNESISKTT